MKAIGGNLTKVAISSNLELEAVRKQIFKPQWLVDGMKRTGLDVITNKDINEIFGIAFRYLFQMGRDLSLIVNSAKHLLELDTDKYVAVHVRAGFVGSAHPEGRATKILSTRKQWEQMLLCAVNMAITLMYGQTVRSSWPLTQTLSKILHQESTVRGTRHQMSHLLTQIS